MPAGVLLQPLRQRLGERSPSASVTRAQLVISSLGIESVARGAATLVLLAALNDPRIFPVLQVSDAGAAGKGTVAS